MDPESFHLLVWKSKDCFTISDYQLLCRALEGLHQHSRQEGEKPIHVCVNTGDSASFLVFDYGIHHTPSHPFSDVMHQEVAARRTALDDDLVGTFSKCLGGVKFQHLHNDCRVDDNRTNSSCIRLSLSNAFKTHQ